MTDSILVLCASRLMAYGKQIPVMMRDGVALLDDDLAHVLNQAGEDILGAYLALIALTGNEEAASSAADCLPWPAP